MKTYILEGNISVKAALLAARREVYEIIVDQKKKDKDTAFILRTAESKQIPIKRLERAQIDEMCEGKTHGGMVAIVGEREYQTLEESIKEVPFLAIVEGIEDPYNFGYICRSLYAAGCHGLIVPIRNWSSEADVVTKSSAGASEYLNIIPVADMAEICSQLKERNIKLYCAMREDAIEYVNAKYNQPICIAFGGEKRGLSAKILKASDQNIYIGYGNEFRNALNGASAVSVIAFEALRQRK